MMTDYLHGLWTAAAVAAVTWPLSVYLRNASIVDSIWSLLFVAQAIAWTVDAVHDGGGVTPRQFLLLGLLTVWALRLALYITWRNLGHGEDRRYQAIRRNHEPGFAWKSLYIVFGLQVLLAWVIAMPLMAALSSPAPVNPLDGLGILLWALGLAFEMLADFQLMRFRARSDSRGAVLDRGLWRYSRHPNYFGEFVLWWGLYLIGASAGAWWTVFSPILMSLLLLRVSGVTLLEKDIAERRPAYRAYVERTSAFVPWPPRKRPGRRDEA
jgi:steroid 5-alpha reductase family enzyme